MNTFQSIRKKVCLEDLFLIVDSGRDGEGNDSWTLRWTGEDKHWRRRLNAAMSASKKWREQIMCSLQYNTEEL